MNYNQNPIIIPIAVPQDGTISEENSRLLLEKIEELKLEIADLKEKKRVGKDKKNKQPKKEYSPLKSDGKPKATATDSIRSYDDFLSIQNYFLEKNSIRDWAFWTVGVCLGIRVSDLVGLKIKNVLYADRTFRSRLQIYEQKTSKINNILITDAIRHALGVYFDNIGWQFNDDDYIFKSQKGGKISPQHGWRIISEAGRFLKLPISIGSHTMRKSFINIATCLREYTMDMNTIMIAQAHLNHSDQRTTLKYLGVLETIKDEDRINVSKFVLGQSKANNLIDSLKKEIK